MVNFSSKSRVKRHLEEFGYTKVDKFMSTDESKLFLEHIYDTLEKYAQELSCSKILYLSSVSRWLSPSEIVGEFGAKLAVRMQNYLESTLEKRVRCQKFGIISKSPYYHHPTICHQDLSYSTKHPYKFSGWLSLNNVDASAGALIMQKYSHNSSIQRPQDYWDPFFQDEHRKKPEWIENSEIMEVKAGDLLLFDSKTWHASTENLDKKDRFAFFTRWEVDGEIYDKSDFVWEDFNQSDLTIRHFFYGIIDLLSYVLLREEVEVILDDYTHVIDSFLHYLDNNDTSFWLLNKDRAVTSLIKLKTTNLARIKHRGEDAVGHTYNDVYHYLMVPIMKHYDIKTI